MLALLLAVAVMAALFVTKGGARTPEDIRRAVREIDPEHNADLQPGAPPAPPDGTWCNKFVAWATSALGAPVPFGEYGTPVNAQVVWLQAGNDGWRVTDAAGAQAGALAGKVALATYFNPQGHGHIALVLPEASELRIAQAGRTNFNDGPLARGFGSAPVVFFVHEDEP